MRHATRCDIPLPTVVTSWLSQKYTTEPRNAANTLCLVVAYLVYIMYSLYTLQYFLQTMGHHELCIF